MPFEELPENDCGGYKRHNPKYTAACMQTHILSSTATITATARISFSDTQRGKEKAQKCGKNGSSFYAMMERRFSSEKSLFMISKKRVLRTHRRLFMIFFECLMWKISGSLALGVRQYVLYK